ncbi:MAG: amino acid adenylation domain-containing protein, partial [Actinobacteria bacterium]|nr:amino acid adenylation domain-containing protein [Actinomycetota bacterium]
VAVHDFVGSGDLVLGFDFNAQLFTQEQRDAMIELFLHVLDECIDRPDGRITDFEVLSDRERRRIDAWNSTRRDYPRETTTIGPIEAQAQRHPTAVAATSGDDALTYAALIERATVLGAHLRDVGAGPGTSVGVCLHRSLDLLVAVLAVMRSGAAYVPLDPAFPPDRLAFMLEDCGASILLTQRDLDGAVDPAGCVVVEIGEVDLAPDPRPAEVAARPGPEDLAYVLYTSGSTGRPKGVEIPHGALTNLLRSMAETPGCGEQDVLLAVTTLSFDISALELFLPLLCGGQVEIASRGLAADGRALRQRLDRGGITMLQATPATWRMLLEAGWEGTEGLTALIGGEPLPPDLVAPLLDRTAALWNMYGPTETTVWSSVERVERADQPITVGRPIANTTFQVLDGRGRRTPIGVAGELVIGGAGVAAGYHGRPELTADRFVPDAFSDTPAARAYRTGDLVRFQSDGRVVHLGRLDSQVKVRGFRIELGEIEATLVQHPAIAQAVVDVRADGPAGPTLVAYCRPDDGELPQVGDLRQYLRTTLPDYMVPARFVMIDEVPLTPNGKVDRRALPDPDPAGRRADGHHVAPRTPAERRLAGFWAELLGTDQIGVHDDFFDLGGHSLLALQLLNRIIDEFGVELPLHRLFEASTLEALAGVIDQATGASPSATRFVPELMSIWCDVLDVAAVGPDDDFLALQADRSLVDAMLLRTRERLGVFAEGLSATDFLRRPTIRGLAELISRNEEPVSSLVVPLRTTGEATPLFLVHAGGGYVFFYRALAAELDGRRPVYAIRAENPRDGLGRPLVAAESIASIAARYIEQIREVQPHGPYLLGGACFGGLVAFDMARQLRAQGEEIAGPLFLFDAVLPNNPALSPDDLDRLRAAGFDARTLTPSLRQALTRKRAEIRTMGPVAGATHLVRAVARRTWRELRRGGALLLTRLPLRSAAARAIPVSPMGARTPEELLLEEYAESLEVAIHLSLAYQPEPTEVSLVVVEAVGSGPLSVSWRGITSGEIAVHRSPGTHLDMLEHPWVRDTAALMDEALSST